MKHMKFNVAIKVTFLAVGLVIGTVLIVATNIYSNAKELLIKDAFEKFEVTSRLTGDRLNDYIGIISEDVHLLSRMPPVQGIIRARLAGGVDPLDNSTEKVWSERLQTIFKEFLQARKPYTQIRYIGIKDNGRELVRVARSGEAITVAGSHELQQKSTRPYFQETIKLESGQIYISEANYNQEYGRITAKNEAVIRVAAPIHTPSGKIFGLVIINKDFRSVVSSLYNEKYNENEYDYYLTNAKGDYIVHSDPAKVFGFEKDIRHQIQKEYPVFSSLFESGNQQKYMTYSSKIDDCIIFVQKVNYDPLDPDRFFGLVISMPYSRIISSSVALVSQDKFLLILMVVAASFLAVLFSYRLIRPLHSLTKAVDTYNESTGILALPPAGNDEFGVLTNAFKDMSRRVEQHRHELKESEEHLSILFSNIIDGLITIDSKGIITEANPSALSIFCYSEKELLGQNINILMNESLAVDHDRGLQTYISDQPSRIIGITRELSAKRKDGTEFPIELSVCEIEQKGEGQKYFTGTVRDITERKETEAALIDARKLAEEANHAKSEFLSRMSHELRTPMNAILGFAQLMESDPDKILSESQKESTKHILKAGWHLLELINRVLDLARIEADEFEMSIETFNVSDVVNESVDLIMPLAEEKKVQLINEIKTHRSVYIRADKIRMKQVMINLISNAVKYNFEGGEVRLFYDVDEGRLRINVMDTGKGINKEQETLLFKPFERLGAENKIEGTGIGLVITRQLVELMDGEIGYECRPGAGCLFWVEFNAAERVRVISSIDDPSTQSTEPGRRIADKVRTMLYIEDDPASIKVIETFIGQHTDLELMTAPTAEFGLGIARVHHPDIILMDINLPGMSGIEAVAKLQSYEETKNIPVIALSANAMRDDIRKGDEAEFLMYLTKPINIQKFMEAIESVMDMEKAEKNKTVI